MRVMDVGYGLVERLFAPTEIQAINDRLPNLGDQSGTRGLLDEGWCVNLATDDRLRSLATNLLGEKAKPVRAILFDKVEGRNWTLGWHQDTKIAVREAKDVPGFTG